MDDFGPVDLSDPAYSGNLKLGMFAGKGSEEDPQGYRDASPIFLVSNTSAPMIIAQGYADKLVPFAQSQRLSEALSAHKVPVQFIANDGGHSEIGLLNAQKAAITDAEIAFITEQTRRLPFPPVDVTTLHHKFIVGYQGWFACPDDGGPMNAWLHWFFDNTPDAEHAHFDLLPDVSEVTAGERCPTKLKKSRRQHYQSLLRAELSVG